MDPCLHPTLTHLVGFLSGHGKGPGPSKELFPVMAMCKTKLHSDVLAVGCLFLISEWPLIYREGLDGGLDRGRWERSALGAETE